MKLSIIIPCYNEEQTLEEIFSKVVDFKKFEKEIIIIDDCSTDNTPNVIKKIINNYPEIKTLRHEKNYGKGTAIKSGLDLVENDIVIIQDADLEYDPKDYGNLIEPFLKTEADIVYGSRFRGGEYSRLHFFWHFVANKILTLLTNIVTNLNMSDMETGYKLFKKDVIKAIDIKEKSFGVEPEITVKLAKKKFVFYEVPISYKGRSYTDGKKITFKDAFVAVFCIFKYKFFD
jgi:glycosyltransferase involved in cell wall biosynthesis